MRALVSALIGLVAALTFAPGAAFAETSPGLQVASSQATYQAGQDISFNVRVTNRGAQACAVPVHADGGVQIMRVTRDGNDLAPVLGQRIYVDGYESALRQDIRTLQPGESVSITLAGVATAVPSSANSALLASWAVGQPGRYHVEMRYSAPTLSGISGCAGLSDVAKVEFSVAKPAPKQSLPSWAPIAAVAAGALVLLAIVIWLLRRRKGAAAAAIFVVALGFVLGVPGRAKASIDVPAPASPDFMDAVGGCLGQLRAFDPAHIMDYFDSPSSPPVHIRPAVNGWQGMSTDGDPGNPNSDIVITWEPKRQGTFYSGTPYEPCPGLLHELSHAYDYAHGKDADNKTFCDSTGVDIGQTRAMIIENLLRAKIGASPHDHSALDKIVDSLDQCDEPPPPGSHSPRVFPQCFGDGGLRLDGNGCAETNGDPHLTTFDGRRYDLQSVGEFWAVRDGSGDLTVQTRQSALPGSRSVSVNTAVAVLAGTTRLGFYLHDSDLLVHRDGQSFVPTAEDTLLPNGFTLTRRASNVPGNGAAYTVIWPDQTMLWIDRIGGYGLAVHMRLSETRRGKVSGILGDWDGKPDNDLVAGADIDKWRITDATSLFDYAAGQSTATFTDKNFPLPGTQPDPAATEAARRICVAFGITDPVVLDACVLDVATTGQASFAAALAAGGRILKPPMPSVSGGTVHDGDLVHGEVTTPGGANRYPLDLRGASSFWVADWMGTTTSCDQSFSINLVDVAYSNFPCTGQAVHFTVPDAAKSYQLEIASTGNKTGPYSFRFVTEKVRLLTTNIGDTVSGNLDVPGRIDVYTFAAGGASSVQLDGPPGTCPVPVEFVVRNAATSDVVHGFQGLCGFTGSLTLPDPQARYTITVSSSALKATTYTFRITR